ncbi:hypothetical protein [Litorimonas sp. WD9-15]|uniref:hypothetical protein n=1 Tax=Litorimonas sp. WD9-15 TaxID=3418716 RepID=UPI003CFF1DDA
MRALISFLWLTVRCVTFLWMIITTIILILFAVGTEAEGYSWAERLQIAALYAGYAAVIFGLLLAVWIFYRTWKSNQRNRKILSKRQSLKER